MTGRNRREATCGKGYNVANREKDASAKGKYNLKHEPFLIHLEYAFTYLKICFSLFSQLKIAL
jgi:hypothetical protein